MKKVIRKNIMCKISLHSWYMEMAYQGDDIISIVSKCSKCGEGKMESMPFRKKVIK